MFGFEHNFFVGDLQEGGRAEWRAQAEEGQRGLLILLVLPMQHLDLAADIQTLETR